MNEPNSEILEVLVEIRDTLNRLFICFEDQYLEIEKRKNNEMENEFKNILTGNRKRIISLLFDKRHLSQAEIAQSVGVNKSTVSRFVNLLIENDYIEQSTNGNKTIYKDKLGLQKLVSRLG